jgi:Xaa-Pro aminopeptidase
MRATAAALKPGMTESQVAAEAERAMRYAGAEEFYRTYVSTGPRTNIAHGLPTSTKINTGDLVMIDLAPIVNGYSADMCRTLAVGKPTAEQRAAYDLSLKAQPATIAKVKAGADMMDLEKTMHGMGSLRMRVTRSTSSGHPCMESESNSRRLRCLPGMPSFTARRLHLR